MYKKAFIILPLLMLAFMCGSVQLSKAAETQSYQSNAVAGFYGEYVFEEGNTADPNQGSNNGDVNTGFTSINHLPITGDQQSAFPLVGALLLLVATAVYVQRTKDNSKRSVN